MLRENHFVACCFTNDHFAPFISSPVWRFVLLSAHNVNVVNSGETPLKTSMKTSFRIVISRWGRARCVLSSNIDFRSRIRQMYVCVRCLKSVAEHSSEHSKHAYHRMPKFVFNMFVIYTRFVFRCGGSTIRNSFNFSRLSVVLRCECVCVACAF